MTPNDIIHVFAVQKGTEVFVQHKQGDHCTFLPICFQYGGGLDVILANNPGVATPSTDPIEPAATAADQTPPRLARETLLGRQRDNHESTRICPTVPLPKWTCS